MSSLLVIGALALAAQAEPVPQVEEPEQPPPIEQPEPAPKVGEPAPDFTLKTLDGQSVTLGEHRGSVVVLDFWATWCPPCRMSLPKLQQFADWAEQDGRAVKVYAVDIFERVQTNEQKKQIVGQFWTKRGFTMPTLMDYDNSVAKAFEVEPIPHMVVIGPQGKIIKIHIGFDPNMVQTLKRETLESLHGDS